MDDETKNKAKEKKELELWNQEKQQEQQQQQHSVADPANVVPIIFVGEMDLGGGGAGGRDLPLKKGLNNNAPPQNGQCGYLAGQKVDPDSICGGGGGGIWSNAFNWKHLRRVAATQMILCMIALTCIVISILTTGLNGYKFSQFIMGIYLLMTGHSGMKGSSKSYKHLIFYLIMSSLQWMFNVMVLGCLTYALYESPYSGYSVRQSMRSVDFDDYGYDLAVLTAELVGSLAMMGTIVTGMLGLTQCCKGFGNLLAKQEKFFQMVDRNGIGMA